MYTTKDLHDFASSQEGYYDYFDHFECALAQFLKAQGHGDVSVSGWTCSFDGDCFDIREMVNDLLANAGTWEGLAEGLADMPDSLRLLTSIGE